MNNTVSKKRRFNIADVIIILIILALAALIARLFLSDDGFLPQSGTDNISFTVKMYGVPTSYHDFVKPGDIVCDEITGNVIGAAEKVEYDTATVSVYDEDARYYKQYSYPDKENVTVTVRTKAALKDGRYVTDGFTINAGTKLQFRVPNLVFSGVITSFEKLPDDIELPQSEPELRQTVSQTQVQSESEGGQQ